MIKYSCTLFLLPVLLLACKGSQSGEPGDGNLAKGNYAWTAPAAGTVVAADSMRIKEDQLNNAYFSVSLRVADNNSGKKNQAFRYIVHAVYGAASTDGVIIMPYGGEHLRPLLRPGTGYTYIMGFVPGKEYGGDTAFHEYYRISSAKEQHIDIVALNGYRIETE